MMMMNFNGQNKINNMKLIFLIFVVFNATQSIYSQNNDTICCNKLDSAGKKVGKWTEFDFCEGDSLKSTAYYENGLVEGIYISYYPNGSIKSIHNFKNGKHHGKTKFYYKNGALNDVFIDENGEQLFHMMFTPSGQIFQESDKNKYTQYK